MIRIFTDSGSSIKNFEKDKLNTELIPLRYLMGDTEYEDDVNITIDEFYKLLIDKNLFPKTSLPYLEPVEAKVNEYTKNGDDVFIITISSHISGTYNAITNLFKDNPKVHIIDSLSCVGGLRLIVEEINKHINEPVETILDKVNKLIPRIKIYAIPETLDYLLKGGRLSRKEWLLGSMLNIKPIISIIGGDVKVSGKKIGITNAMKHIVQKLEQECDENYSIVPSYTYNDKNLKKLIDMTNPRFKKCMTDLDNLDPAIACHWGPNAFGYIFIGKENN